MTVARPGGPPAPLDVAREHVERALGPTIAKRLGTFKDGAFPASRTVNGSAPPGPWRCSSAPCCSR